MKNILSRSWSKARGCVAGLSLALFGVVPAFAQESGGSAYAPDFTEATTAITDISSGIVDWIKGTVMGKIIAVVVVFVVVRIVIGVIKWFGRSR